MNITCKLRFVLLTYYFVIGISINLLTASSEAAGGPPPPTPPPTPMSGLDHFKSSGHQSWHNPKGDQSQHNNTKSRTTSNNNTSSPPALEVPEPTGEFGKKYAKLINMDASLQNLIIQFPTTISSLIRHELTLKNSTADVDKILALFSKKDEVILSEAKEKYEELIQDPYIAQFVNTKNNAQTTGNFLDNKLFGESQEEATLRLLSLKQLEKQKKQQILTKQGDILGQLKFINEHSEVLGEYGKTASADISKKLPKELPKILSKQSDELEQLKFINENSEILGKHSKAILKDTLKKLSKELDNFSNKQLVGFILNENQINTNLRNVPFSKKEVRELIDSLNNKILEKIFLQDDGTITEQKLAQILQENKEADLIKNLTRTMVYIDGNKDSSGNEEALNKTLEKGLENTTKKQRELFVNVMTSDSLRIKKVFMDKIERDRNPDKNTKPKVGSNNVAVTDAVKKVFAQHSNLAAMKKEIPTNAEDTRYNIRNMRDINPSNNQNDNQDTQNNNNGDNEGVDEIAKAHVNAPTSSSSSIQKVVMNQIKSPYKNIKLKVGSNNVVVTDAVKKVFAQHSNLAAMKKEIPTNAEDTRYNIRNMRDINPSNNQNDNQDTQNNNNGDNEGVDETEWEDSDNEGVDAIAKAHQELVKAVNATTSNFRQTMAVTLDGLKKKEENKHDNAESVPEISKEILEAQEGLKKAEEGLKYIKRKQEEERQRQEEQKRKQEEDRRHQEEQKRKQEEERQRQEEQNRKQEEERQRQEEQNRKQEEERRRQEDQNSQEQDHQSQEEQKRKQEEEANRKAADEAAEQKEEESCKLQEDQNHQEQEHQSQEEQNHKQKEANEEKARNQEENQDEGYESEKQDEESNESIATIIKPESLEKQNVTEQISEKVALLNKVTSGHSVMRPKN